MRMVDPYLPEECRFRARFLTATIALAALAGAVLVAWPEIDLEISRALRQCPGASYAAPWCAMDPTVQMLRQAFVLLSVIVALAAIIITARTIWERGLVGLAQARCFFLVAALAVGPGLVANVILKDNWGRARPRQVVEFGGTQQFTPPLLLAGECERNCSFVSGEASATFVPFFAAALLFPQARIALLGVGALAGLASGLIRMSQGAHFLSDVLFAGLFMAITASLLHILFIGVWRQRNFRRDLATVHSAVARLLASRASRPTVPGAVRLEAAE